MNEDKVLDDLQVYEVGYHLLPTVSEAELPVEVSKIQSSISERNGAIISEGFPQLRQLAYEIKKAVDTKYHSYSKAYFGWIKFEIDRSQIGEIENLLQADQNVLRFIVVKTVRENTLYAPKAPVHRKDYQKEELPKESAEKPEISEEEIDKSIDELVIS
jgi:ribosomal protein S6